MSNEIVVTVLLFDGTCNLCNGSVRFVARHDPVGRVAFATLQSDAGRRLLERFHLSSLDLQTMVLIEGDRHWTKSDAWLRVVRRLRQPWPVLGAALIAPRFIRDAVYDVIARKRYRWWGKREVCEVPDAELAGRLLK